MYKTTFKDYAAFFFFVLTFILWMCHGQLTLILAALSGYITYKLAI